MVLSFQADNHPYLFSLHHENFSLKDLRGKGSIWRIKDRAAGWERVYWPDHRESPYDTVFGGSGYYPSVCTTFDLDDGPYMFMMYVRGDYPFKDKNPAYIVRLEKRNWIRVVNEGGYVAKIFIQYEENGSTVTKESGDLPILSHKVWHLPPETRTVLISAQAHTGLKWNTIHRGEVAVNGHLLRARI